MKNCYWWKPGCKKNLSIGPAMEHYICHHLYVNSTWYKWIVEVVELLPHHAQIPFVSSANYASLAAVYLTEILIHPNIKAPLSHLEETQLAYVRQLVTLFQSWLNKPGAPPRLVQTSPAHIIGDPAPTRLDTTAPPRVAHRITAPYQRVDTKKHLHRPYHILAPNDKYPEKRKPL